MNRAAQGVRVLLAEGQARLEAVGIESSRVEVEWLLGALLGTTRGGVYLHEPPVTSAMITRFHELVAARAQGMPLQYLTTSADFCGMEIRVRPGAFIPRPETEAVATAAIAVFGAYQRVLQRPLRVLDLGTGSGCVAIVVASALPACVVVGVELSWDALSVASANVRAHGLAARISLCQGRWLEALQGPFDGIVSNPPYIPSAEIARLPLEVRCEPRSSLDGGPDGLSALRQLVATAGSVLAPGASLVLECSPAQVEPVGAAATAGWATDKMSIHDLNGRACGLILHRDRVGDGSVTA